LEKDKITGWLKKSIEEMVNDIRSNNLGNKEVDTIYGYQDEEEFNKNENRRLKKQINQVQVT
jgi:hypothetical protein